jgi:hypothetical protein
MAEVSIRTFVHPFNSAHPHGTTSLELHCYTRILNDGTRYAMEVLSRQQILHLFRRLSTTTSFSLHTPSTSLPYIQSAHYLAALAYLCSPAAAVPRTPPWQSSSEYGQDSVPFTWISASVLKGSICHRPHSGLVLIPPSSTEHARPVGSSRTNDATRAIS